MSANESAPVPSGSIPERAYANVRGASRCAVQIWYDVRPACSSQTRSRSARQSPFMSTNAEPCGCASRHAGGAAPRLTSRTGSTVMFCVPFRPCQLRHTLSVAGVASAWPSSSVRCCPDASTVSGCASAEGGSSSGCLLYTSDAADE